jgi:hypothetical protein
MWKRIPTAYRLHVEGATRNSIAENDVGKVSATKTPLKHAELDKALIQLS